SPHHRDYQPAVLAVTRFDRAVMQGNRSCRDREPQTFATPGSIASRIHAVERLEDELEILVRYTRTMVVDDHLDAILRSIPGQHAASSDPNLRVRGAVANRVPDDVLERAAQELHI